MIAQKLFSVVSLLFCSLLCHVCCQNNVSNHDSSVCSTVVALILARGGSKGIKMKNIREIETGKSLLGNSLIEIQKAKFFASVWVSTDNEDIAKEARKCKKMFFF